MKQWTRQIATDIDVVDTHHKQLFQLIGAFATCCHHVGPSERLLRLALRGLIDYSRTHFDDEEQMMKDAGVDPRHIAKHQMEHRSFIYDINQLEAQMDVVTCESVAHVSEKLVRFMSAWLVRHIIGTDQTMAAQIAAINRGVSAQDAFLQHQFSKQDATVTRVPADAASEPVGDSHAQSWRLAKRLDALRSSSEKGAASTRLAA